MESLVVCRASAVGDKFPTPVPKLISDSVGESKLCMCVNFYAKALILMIVCCRLNWRNSGKLKLAWRTFMLCTCYCCTELCLWIWLRPN